MTIAQLLQQIRNRPESIEFQQVMETIDQNYHYTPARFTNGDVINENGTNEGSCKIFAFGKLNNLSGQETLACFGSYYRDDVLNNPEGTDHANIRTFIKQGWNSIQFDTQALETK